MNTPLPMPGGVEHRRIIDVGANIGDTIVGIGDRDAEYLAIEGETEYFGLLMKNTENFQVFYENMYLSDTDEMGQYVWESVNGTSRLVSSEENRVRLKTLSALMEEKYKGFVADILKVDTDGFDLKIIKGARDYLDYAQPMIFFEWDKSLWNAQGSDEMEVFELLESLGYRDILLWDNFGNFVLEMKADQKCILENLAHYTLASDKRIFYFDILAIPERFLGLHLEELKSN